MQQEKRKNNKLVLIIALVLVVLIAGATTAYFLTRPATQAGAKTVTVVVDAGQGTANTHTINTDEEFLGPMLLNEGIAKGENGEFGLFITEVDGIAADESQQQWWAITKGGEEVFTGADTTPIADGETFELTLQVW